MTGIRSARDGCVQDRTGYRPTQQRAVCPTGRSGTGGNVRLLRQCLQTGPRTTHDLTGVACSFGSRLEKGTLREPEVLHEDTSPP